MAIYEPEEDSFLILKFVKKYAHGKTLDMGSGSGIIAKECLKFTDDVYAVDISKEVVLHLKKIFKDKIKVIHSDLFSNVEGVFDVIFFNPPYLPKEEPQDIALDGGKQGNEIIILFLKQAKKHINGKIILLFSSLSGKREIDEVLKKLNYSYKTIATKNLFFEKLYLYEIENEN